MKRVGTHSAVWTVVATAFLLMFTSVLFAQREPPLPAPGEEEIMNNPAVQSAVLNLYSESRLVPSRVRAMWITLENGEYGVIPWPPSEEAYVEFWKGPLPEHAVAIVHTCPMSGPERPSADDYALASGSQVPAIRMPVYTLHHLGIWKAIPGNSTAVQVCASGWTGEFARRSRDLKTQRSQVETH